jgi:3-deoxy-D-manno-octulosonic-acid transferase
LMAFFSLLMAFYSLLLVLVMVVGSPWWLLRMLTSGRYRAGLAGRLGLVPAEVSAAGLDAASARRRLVWVHAVSVGEVLAATALVGALREAGLVVAVSTTTLAGQELAKKRFAGCAVFYMPLDLGVLVRRYLRALRPGLVVTMESELWPNVIQECERAGIPLAVVNARVSDRSFPRYMRLKWVWGPLLREVTLFLAQSEETAGRLRKMGVAAERVRVTGNLKFDVRAGEVTAMTRRVGNWVSALAVELVVAGSTVPGEEEALLEVWLDVQRKSVPAAAMLLIAPRHTDRFDDVFALIERQGYVAVRCSGLPEVGAERFLSGNVVLLLDTIGDLASMYSVGTVAFVGGSLVAKGGHNPLEPAQFGVPVVMGSSCENFKEIVGAMKDAEAIRIVERQELGAALVGLLTDRVAADAMGARGREVFEAQAGATGRTMAALRQMLGER